MDAGLLGKVNLPPVPGAAQFPYPLTRCRTDFLCHPSMIGLAFALYLAHTLFVVRKAETMHLFRKPSVLLLVVTALLPFSAAARAQQDADVTVIIKAKTKPTTLPTLLVLCDLVCNWKLDGEVKGQIEAGGSAKVKVEPGQHVVEATTEDGIDGVKQPSTVKPTGQTMVSIELQPVRDFRLIAQQELRDQEAQARAAKEQAALDAREEAIGVWTDPATGLMWTKKDSGRAVSWLEAFHYCQNLQLAGHSDWRLPEIDELLGIYDSSIDIRGSSDRGKKLTWHVKGNLKLSGDVEVSNTTETGVTTGDSHAPPSKLFWAMEFFESWGKRFTMLVDIPSYAPTWNNDNRALCVRRSGD